MHGASPDGGICRRHFLRRAAPACPQQNSERQQRNESDIGGNSASTSHRCTSGQKKEIDLACWLDCSFESSIRRRKGQATPAGVSRSVREPTLAMMFGELPQQRDRPVGMGSGRWMRKDRQDVSDLRVLAEMRKTLDARILGRRFTDRVWFPATDIISWSNAASRCSHPAP